MKKMSVFSVIAVIFVFCGCNCIGNGVAKTYNYPISSPLEIEIEGDWRAEIICGSDKESCEIIIDENLSRRFSVKSGRELKIWLPEMIAPMTAPTVKIYLKKPFRKLSVEGSSLCVVKKLNSNAYTEVDVSDRAVCIFEGGNISEVEAEVSDKGKLTFKNQIKSVRAEVDDRGVLEIDYAGNLFLETSDNGVCRVNKCVNASVEAEDSSFVEFKEVKDISERVFDRAEIKRPYTLPAK